MTDSEYSAWQKVHSTLFRLLEGEEKFFLVIKPVLQAFEFSELKDASYAIVLDPSDRQRYRDNHLSMLREAVLTKRAEQAERERERLDRQYAQAECEDCAGIGIVRAPHPGFVVNGEMERPFFIAVACSCPSGATRFNAINAGRQRIERTEMLMDLAQYEALVPDWRGILQRLEESLEREAVIADVAREIDRVKPIDMEDVKRAVRGGKAS